MPTGAQGHGLGHLWQRLGPCAVLSGSVLAKSIFPVRGSLQAELGEQDRVPWCRPWKRTLPTGGAGGSQGRGRARQQCAVRKAREPPDSPLCFSSVLVQLVIRFQPHRAA